MQAPHFSHRQGRLKSPPDASSGTDQWLLRAYDILVALCLFAGPLVLGGRHPVGRLVFVVLALLAACLWCARQALGATTRWKPSWADGIVGAAVLLVAFQLVPLPEAVHRTLSPASAELLPLWTASSGSSLQLGDWNTISLAPYETRIGLLVLLGYVALFVTASQRINSAADVERYLRWIAWAACGMAVLGIAQYLFGNGKFLWTYTHPFRETINGAKGPFVNRNHFAQFLAVGIGPLLWLVYRELRAGHKRAKPRSEFARTSQLPRQSGLYLASGMLLVTLFAALLSFSRGGILSLACVMGIGLALLAWKRLLDRKALLMIGSAMTMVLLSLAIHGLGKLSTRLESLASLSDDTSAQMRLSIWHANWQMAKDFYPAGIGAGAHPEVYPLYLDDDCRVEFTHAENGYLQVLSENGVMGIGLLLAAFGLAGSWCLRAVRTDDLPAFAASAAIVASLAAPLLHGGVDFVWWIPACMTPTLLLLACLRFQASQHSLPRDSGRQLGWNDSTKVAWTAGAVASGVLVLAAATHLIGPALAASSWEQYLAMSLATKQFRAAAHAQGGTAAWGALDPESPEIVGRMARHLETALLFDPDNPRTNARMAAVRLRQFAIAQRSSDNPMSLAMIRDAALASRFPSRSEQDAWLTAALADNYRLLGEALRSATRAVHGSPMQGEVYTNLAELSFLGSPRAEYPAQLIDQALRVRPHSGNVLLAAGREAAIAGEQERALELLHKAFHSEREIQKLVIELIAPQTSTAEFLTAFQPDLAGLRLLRAHHREAQRAGAAAEVSALLAKACADEAAEQEGLAAARLWREASQLQRERGDIRAALAAAQQAANAAPLDYDTREHLAHTLIAAQHYEAAAKQWQWCLTRKPGSDRIRQQIKAAKRLHLTSGVSALEQAARAETRR